MDSRSFDRIAAALGAAASRRAGIAAALAAAFGGAAGAPEASAAARSARSAARPAPASPCGKRKSSTCRNDSDCCRGACNRALSDANNDGLGRCRCSRRNEPCGDAKDCCNRKKQGMVCREGVCSAPCAALGQTCNAKTVCCAGACAAVAGGQRAQAATCCLALGASGCTADSHCCGGNVCVGGVCAAPCVALGRVCALAENACCAGACVAQGAGWERGLAAVCCLSAGQTGCTEDRHCCQNAGQLFCALGKCGAND